MKNIVVAFEDADKISFTNGTGSAIASGQVISLGTRLAVALSTIAIGAIGTVLTEGIFALTKQTGEAYSVGQILGWDAANSRVTTDTSGRQLVEVTRAALSADTSVEVRLNSPSNPRIFQRVLTPTAGEDTANQMDVNVGFPTTGAHVSCIIINTSGVARTGQTFTPNPGAAAPNVLRIADANLAATDRVHLTVTQVTSS